MTATARSRTPPMRASSASSSMAAHAFRPTRTARSYSRTSRQTASTRSRSSSSFSRRARTRSLPGREQTAPFPTAARQRPRQLPQARLRLTRPAFSGTPVKRARSRWSRTSSGRRRGATADLQVDGATKKDDAADGQDTGFVTVDTGNHSVGGDRGRGRHHRPGGLFEFDRVRRRGQQPRQVGGGTSLTGIAVGNGAEITCTITNTRETGTIEVIKDLEPDGDPGPLQPADRRHHRGGQRRRRRHHHRAPLQHRHPQRRRDGRHRDLAR